MKSKRGWVILSMLLITGFLGAGAYLLYGGNGLGAFLLVGALYLAKDLVNLGVSSKAREVRRAAYAESGVWRKAGSEAAADEPVVITVPNDRYFESILDESPAVNPATGLFMIGGVAGVDLAGNMYGHQEALEPDFGSGSDSAAGFDDGPDSWDSTTDLNT